MCFTLTPAPDDRAFLEARPIKDPQIKKRVLIERLIVRSAVQNLISKGYALELIASDGGQEGPLCRPTRDWHALMAEVQSCDEETILVYGCPEEGAKMRLRGAISLVYGNDGWDVIADLSVWVDAELEAVNALADKIADTNVVVYS